MNRIEAACGCSKGKVRANNEDNFYFAGEYLPAENDALPTTLTGAFPPDAAPCFAVFDGMGGERYGELAAHAAARRMKTLLSRTVWSGRDAAARLEELSLSLNAAVLEKAREVLTRHMGSTMAGLLFADGSAYAFNLGDSRVYRSRGDSLTQLSVDHVDSRALFSRRAKPSLTQHLGIDEEDFVVEPTIVRCQPEPGDCFLLCSDGLTDMLTDAEIGSLLRAGETARDKAETLIASALDRGGRDNVTVIVCEVR